MKKIWWAQAKAVIRLEMKKTFFAKRGIWIYLAAALPVLIFVAFSMAYAAHQHKQASMARQAERPLTYQDLMAIKKGMATAEVRAILGKPPLTFHWTEPRPPEKPGSPPIVVQHDSYQYSDGQDDLYVIVSDGKVDTVQIRQEDDLGQKSVTFAGVFQFFFLRLVVFFGCLGIFMNLFRGEILDRSLHFYFLSPVRREVVMAGKFVAGLLATSTIFVTSEILQTVAFLWHFSPSSRDVYLYHNHGLEHAAIYVGVTVLACIGYGSFFLVAGMLFRNPILPAAAILIWEGINPFLPSVLRHFSVIYYLKSLCPVDIPTPPGTPAVMALLISNANPIAAPIAIIGILAVACVALYVSSMQVRRMEINYTTE